ncbi:hypothetical protein [Streptomyces purpurogeneiscleroticus]|uniref:hypothetical protein n=1 Tax=Streptomyces purpurogeneiscleroticus TaxID=68259 RepID=UPI001CC0F88B|nr:hypothetical protein [Streptomyces purpurogeneiscleroticus]
MTATIDLLTVARAEALFSSDLPTGSQLRWEELAAAVGQAIRHRGGTRGCAAVLAGAYGEYPQTAVCAHALGAAAGPRCLPGGSALNCRQERRCSSERLKYGLDDYSAHGGGHE